MRVLLIEDDSATAQSIELMLKSEGFNVYTTDLGEEGVHDPLVGDLLQHLATVVDVALLRLGDEALRDRAQTARLGLGGGDAAVLEE